MSEFQLAVELDMSVKRHKAALMRHADEIRARLLPERYAVWVNGKPVGPNDITLTVQKGGYVVRGPSQESAIRDMAVGLYGGGVKTSLDKTK